MPATSKVIMGATLVMVVSLAIIIGLVLVLLAELYCSLLLRRRQLRHTSSSSHPLSSAATANAETNDCPSEPHQLQGLPSAPQPLRRVYAQGVLRAPRSLLFPSVPTKEDLVDIENQHFQLHHFFQSPAQAEPPMVSTSPPSPLISSPKPIEKIPLQGGDGCGVTISGGFNDDTCGSGGGTEDDFMYISNPIYDNDASRPTEAGTPFETPDTSPSHLGTGGFSGKENTDQSSYSASPSSLPHSPPLTPMKKLPAEACSVSLRDARCLATSGSGSNSNNGLSSSSSGSPCTSPSW